MLGWIGNVFIVFGLYGIGNKQRHAFIASMVGEALWVANALIRPVPDYALGAICVVFFGMAARSWVKWA